MVSLHKLWDGERAVNWCWPWEPFNISTEALPASVHCSFLLTIPLPFLCLERLFHYSHGLCRSPPCSHSGLALSPTQEDNSGFSWLEVWTWGVSGRGVSLSPSCRQGPCGWHIQFRVLWVGVRDRGAVPCHLSGERPGVCPAPRMAADGAGWSEVQLPSFRLVFIFQAERKLVIPKPFCVWPDLSFTSRGNPCQPLPFVSPELLL